MGAAATKAWGPGTKLACDQEHSNCIYLDYNATTPVFPEVADEMEPFLRTHFGNPSSNHAFGRPCKDAIDVARSRIAALLGCHPSEVIFTACGTESDNHAILGGITSPNMPKPPKGSLPHVVSTAIEHPAVLEALVHYKAMKILDYTLVPVDSEGRVEAGDVEKAIRPNTRMITVMHSNNEVGSIQPIAEIAAVAAKHRCIMHTDAAQSVGKVPVKVNDLGVDLMTIVGHKFGAPKGVAALYVRGGLTLGKLLHGGGQESGRRAGTESVLLIAGLGKAAEIAEVERESTPRHMRLMRDHLLSRLVEGLPEGSVRINGPSSPDLRLPNTLSVSVKGLAASQLLLELSRDVAASAGAACHSSGGPTISSVLAAMKVDPEFAVGTLRLSVGRHTVVGDVDRAADKIIECAAHCMK